VLRVTGLSIGGIKVKRVVVADEDPVSRQAAAAVLHDLDCDVETVADAASVLRHLRRTPPDAYLVSGSLSSMPTSDFVHVCKETPRLADVPIVVMAVTPRAAIDAIREGARGCIRKPVDTGGVVAALSDVLRSDPSV
jgi:CheY-like chemotaxis protein